jgi:hypothetical protein
MLLQVIYKRKKMGKKKVKINTLPQGKLKQE